MRQKRPAEARDGQVPPAERLFLLGVVSVFSFLNPFMSSALNVAIPTLGRELGVSAVTVNWVVAAYLVASAALLLPAGRAGDVFGRRRVFLAGAVAYGVFSLACALAQSGMALIVFRALQGAGAALSFATGVAILVAAFPPSRRGRVLGLTIAAVYAGLSAGPVVGGIITHHLGWRALFHVNAVVSVAVAAILVLGSHIRDDAGVGSFRLLDALLYAASLGAVMTAAAGLRSQAWAPGLFVIGAGWLVFFLVRQSRASAPLLDLTIFRNLGFSCGNAAALINYSSTFAVAFLLSIYVQIVRGYDAGTTGMLLLAQPVVMTILSPLAGRLSDRVQPRVVASAGLVLTAAGLALCAGLNEGSSLLAVVVAQLVIGVGFGLFSSPNTNAVMGAAAPRHFGVASAVLATMRLVGQALSMAVVTVLFAAALGDDPIAIEAAPRILMTIRRAFALFAVLNLAAVSISMARGGPSAESTLGIPDGDEAGREAGNRLAQHSRRDGR